MKKNNKINLKLVFNILFYFKAWLGLNNLYSLFYKYLIYKNNIYLINYISSLYGIKDLFNNFILWNLNWREKTHYIFLNNLLKILIEFYRSNISFSKGFLCIVKGKINGISRKRTFKINLGSFGLQYFNLNIICRVVLWWYTNRYTYTIDFMDFVQPESYADIPAIWKHTAPIYNRSQKYFINNTLNSNSIKCYLVWKFKFW